MNMYKCTLLVPVFWLLLLTLTTDSVSAEGQYDDRRCKCVCPPRVINNVTRKVYLKNNIARDDCECGKVVDPLPDNPVEFCLRCECEYESRNTMLMKVLVLFVLAVLGVLVVYAWFIMCVGCVFPGSGTVCVSCTCCVGGVCCVGLSCVLDVCSQVLVLFVLAVLGVLVVYAWFVMCVGCVFPASGTVCVCCTCCVGGVCCVGLSCVLDVCSQVLVLFVLAVLAV
ncbi:uncharacterized protein [Branchiostoma lanceolatum]|uniref:uncharacterized protein isoform X1 n=1 Tax=Branchiostoma lanceolatum TaxID=7740 RepID=UPI003454FADF